MLAADLTLAHLAAALAIIACWFSYSFVLRTFARGSLNAQLATVRRRWIERLTARTVKPFDAILLGQIINAVAFFGSATLLVFAGILTAFANLTGVYATFEALPLAAPISIELFALQLAFLAFILSLSFFSFTYALRKLIYTLALTGALPDAGSAPGPEDDELRAATAAVLSEAVKTFNFGIRGYYYAVAALMMVVSPYASLATTAVVTVVLFYRQLATPSAHAIRRYVDALERDTLR
ncbi:MAG: DUF599 domain-containing protein [Pseudomonadota bacterium]